MWCFFLENPLDYREIKPVNSKGNQPEYSLKGLMLKLQHFGHPMWRTDSLEKTLTLGKIDGRRKRGQRRMRWLDGWHHRLSGHEFEQTLEDSKGQRSLACCSPWSRKESDMIQQLNNNNNERKIIDESIWMENREATFLVGWSEKVFLRRRHLS